MSNVWNTLRAVLPHTRRTLLYGPPGTGKTYCALHERPDDQEFFSFNVQEDTPVAEARGHYIPKGSEMVWQHGPCINAWLRGGRLVINEIDRGSPEIQSFLYMMCDDAESAFYTLPTGQTVKPHAEFSVVATMNGDPESLPEALRDRFPIQIYVDTIAPEALKRLSADIRELAANTALAAESTRRISIRAWLEFDRLRSIPEMKLDVAARAVFGARASELIDAMNIADLAELLPEDQRGVWRDLK